MKGESLHVVSFSKDIVGFESFKTFFGIRKLACSWHLGGGRQRKDGIYVQGNTTDHYTCHVSARVLFLFVVVVVVVFVSLFLCPTIPECKEKQLMA